jgi:D-sedoheptulose 7-phosphate isomerase
MNHSLNYRAVAADQASVLTQFFDMYAEALEALARNIANAFDTDNKLFFCGNGGSACDSMHIAGEFVGRFKAERRSLPAIALSADSGILTAIANDYDFSRIFARQIEGLARTGDWLIALSTSGRSPNIHAALEAARQHGVMTVLITGQKGTEFAQLAEECFIVPSMDTARIQECTMTALHALAEGVENLLYSRLTL